MEAAFPAVTCDVDARQFKTHRALSSIFTHNSLKKNNFSHLEEATYCNTKPQTGYTANTRNKNKRLQTEMYSSQTFPRNYWGSREPQACCPFVVQSSSEHSDFLKANSYHTNTPLPKAMSYRLLSGFFMDSFYTLFTNKVDKDCLFIQNREHARVSQFTE